MHINNTELLQIEEQILESLAWKGDSPLWDAIEATDMPIPSCEDVSLPGQLTDDTTTVNPLNNPTFRRLVLPGTHYLIQ